jgi:hypothetical protein
VVDLVMTRKVDAFIVVVIVVAEVGVFGCGK